MTSKLSPQDEEILRRLLNLKNTGANYPADLLEKRRNAYQRAAMGLVLGVPALGIGKGLLRFLPRTGPAIFKSVLIGALAIEAGVGAYVFHDQIIDWFVGTETPVVTVLPSIPQPTMTGTATFTPTPTETITLVDMLRPTDQGYHYGQTKTPKH